MQNGPPLRHLQVLHKARYLVRRDRVAHARIDPEREACLDLPVDPNNLAIESDQGAARVAAIDGQVNLDRVIVGLAVAVNRADNSHRYRRFEIRRGIPNENILRAGKEGVAQGEHALAGPDRLAVAELEKGKLPLALELQQGNISTRIPADHGCLEIPPACHIGHHRTRAGNDVIVRENITIGADTEAGAAAIAGALISLDEDEGRLAVGNHSLDPLLKSAQRAHLFEGLGGGARDE